MKRAIRTTFLLVLFSTAVCTAQGLDLDSLYLSQPSVAERSAIVDSFHITLTDGPESYAKWSLYDPYLFRPDSTAPSLSPLVNGLRVIRESRFDVPLPFGGGDLYSYLLDHFRNGHIDLWLGSGGSSGGGNVITLAAVSAFWDGRSSSTPFSPLTPFSVYPFVHRTQLLVHETRHCDPDDPGHVPGGKDSSLAIEGAYGRACIYQMWIWKHGLNFSHRQRTAAAIEAKDFLANRFVAQPATHPNTAIQAIIDELAVTPVFAVVADAGRDTNIVIPATAAGIAVKLDGSGSFSLYAPIVLYRWYCAAPYYYIQSPKPDTTLFLIPGEYTWRLDVKNAWEAYSRNDTLVVRVIRTATSVENGIGVPARTRLTGNYPNPFNPYTEIQYDLAEPSHVRLSVENLLGQEVALLVEGPEDAGSHRITFDATRHASGVYLCRLVTGTRTDVHRMVLVR